MGFPYFWKPPICLQMGWLKPTTNYIVNDQHRPWPRRGVGLIAVRMPSSRLSDAARPLQALPTSNDLRADRKKKKKHPMTDASMGRWYVYLPTWMVDFVVIYHTWMLWVWFLSGISVFIAGWNMQPFEDVLSYIKIGIFPAVAMLVHRMDWLMIRSEKKHKLAASHANVRCWCLNLLKFQFSPCRSLFDCDFDVPWCMLFSGNRDDHWTESGRGQRSIVVVFFWGGEEIKEEKRIVQPNIYPLVN